MQVLWSEEDLQEFILSCSVGLGIQLLLQAHQKAPWPIEPSHLLNGCYSLIHACDSLLDSSG